MKPRLLFAVISCSFLFISCDKELTNTDIDLIIKNYDAEDFSCLNGIYVGFKGRDELSNTMLMVDKFDLQCPPYIATLNTTTKKLLKTDNHLIDEKCGGYFTQQQIEAYSACFMKYKFKVLGVDNQGNLYINPFEKDIPVLLRKAPDASPKDLDQFKLYRGNWYVRK